MKADRLRQFVTALGFVLGFYVLAVILQPIFFANRFGAYTHIAGVDVGYQTASAARDILEQKYNDYIAGKIVLAGEEVTAGELVASADFTKTVDAALLEEQRSYFNFSKVTGQRHTLELTYNDAAISKLLLPAYDKLAAIPVDASITLGAKFAIVPEQYGQHLLLAESRELITTGLADMSGRIHYKVVSQVPALTAVEAGAVVNDAERVVAEPIALLGDAAEPVLAAGRVLLRHQPDPGSKTAPR